MSTSSPAWLIDCGSGKLVAISLASVLHVIEDMSLLFRIPLAPAHCNQVLLWQERVLPAVDLVVQLRGAASHTKTQQQERERHSYACLLGWRETNAVTEYGVLLVRALPRRIVVDDDSMVDPPAADIAPWRDITLSFFSYHGRTIPIVDPAAIFGSPSLLAAQTPVQLKVQHT